MEVCENMMREPTGPASAVTAAPAQVSTNQRFASRNLPIAPVKQAGITMVLLVADVVALVSAGLLATVHQSGRIWGLLVVVIAAVLCIQAAGHMLGIYNVRSAIHLQRSCLAAFGLGLVLTGLAAFMNFAFAGSISVSRHCLISCMVIIELISVRLALATASERFATFLAERLVLVGTPSGMARVLTPAAAHVSSATNSIAQADVEARLAGWLCITPDQAGAGFADSLPNIYGVGALLSGLNPAICAPTTLAQEALVIGNAVASASKVDRIVIVGSDLQETAVAWAVKRLEHLSPEISLAPAAAVPGDRLDRSNCVVLRRAAISPSGLIIKRVMDTVGALCISIVALPIALIIAILIRLSSPGPILFRQKRWGLNNVPFTVYKFRTMWVDAPATDGSLQATRNDPRVTPIGAFLRRTSLDELPQLLNVLNGTMSLVGPRPHPVELNRRCVGEIENYLARHRVAPGITGLAQIKGLRGETRCADLMRRRVDCDVEYIHKRSVLSDVGILLKTFISVLAAENAY